MPELITLVAYTRATLALIALFLLITREAWAIWQPPTSSLEMAMSKHINTIESTAACVNMLFSIIERDTTCYMHKASEGS